jgi:hydrophobe/amphiphile efflux-1 (HAE1) family protein
VNISQFFIDRPIFASVLSIVITIVGGIALMTLPVAQYPEIVPPTVQVSASYSGANARTVAETLGAPIEQQVNGVENMLYMSSQSASDGSYGLTVTFKLGTNLDTAQVLVQNRVNLALPVLPEEVRRTGVSVNKQSASMIMAVNLISPDDSRDELYLNNYALLQIKDTLARIDGVGSITIFGSEYSMRIWLDPNKLAALDLTASDLVQAIQEQNKQVAAGVVGQQPAPKGTQFQVVVNAQGRLVDPAEFSRIVVKRGQKGEVIRLSEVGTVDLGAKTYAVTSNLDGKPAATLAIYQLPGSNALTTAKAVRKTMDTLKQSFPSGVDYRVVYDTTVFVNESIRAVEHTLLEAVALVAIVVMLFLQTWRATIIPLIAVPVSLIGTFAAMAAFGFSLNTISLFGLVLAIGIVVDDAIVVVEAIEHKLSLGMSPRDAARQAMNEVGGAVIAVALVLSAVFIPTAFITGITGQFFRQFALTIAVSTIISAFNSLTMSPALGVILLRPHGEPKDFLTRFFNGAFGWFFRGFNKAFDWMIDRYGRSVAGIVRKLFICGVLYLGLLALTGYGFKITPVGFVPQQDQGYLIVACQLPDAASLERTQAVTAKALALIKETPGITTSLVIDGFSMLSGSNQSNVGSIIVILDEFDKRKSPALSANAILQNLRAKFNQIPQALIFAFGPPPILSTMASVQETFGPGVVTRYNLYTAADLSGDTKPGYSSGHAISVMEDLCRQLLPPAFGFEWTDLTYQQILAGNTALFIFPLCVLFVFLTLAAQYESWALPFSIILIVPMCLLSSLAGVLLRGLDNNIFTQIGFVVLVGLACKNAILIVEYAKQIEDTGKDAISAVVEACKLRLRPILMTSFAFIAGVVPLMLGSGAGAEMRQTLGTAVFAGMLGVTIFGIFLTPVFYVIIRKFAKRPNPATAKVA